MDTLTENGSKAFNVGNARQSVQSQFEAQTRMGTVPDTILDYGLGFSLDFLIPSQIDQIPEWSYFPARRDAALRKFWKTEPLMSGAVFSIQARLRALQFHVDSEMPSRKKFYQNLFENAHGGAGFEDLIGRTVIDLLTQDNGAFWELTGAGSVLRPLVGPVQGINHLDSARCWRTFDPTFPVIYVDPVDGKMHKLHHTRVVRLSQMTQPNELARGIGFCAVSRALRATQVMKAIQIFKLEKITGSQTGIGYGNGFNYKQFKEAIQAAQIENEAEGLVMWKRVPFILNPDSSANVNLDVLSLAGLPEGFDEETDTTLYIYALALAFGVDAREFWPATTAGATKADASIQHLKARGKGLGDLIQTIESAIKRSVLPPDGKVEAVYDFTDDEQDVIVAQKQRQRIDTLKELKDMGAISEEEIRTLAFAEGILDSKLIPEEMPAELKDANMQARLARLQKPEDPEGSGVGSENTEGRARPQRNEEFGQ